MLQMIVRLTKQEGKLTVLLTSSEHGYPYKLPAIGLSLADLGTVIHVGEVPPGEMRELITVRWGMGDRLADSFLAVLGSHVFSSK
jgi:hypothetical protein